ncbi:PIF1 helicase [Elysia marginata]|uniref:PIF1 helicase n=1 Tax=Elysia marginata TaxID=1093978 RepID=A0AAV4GXF7_9GAST|nr:PIF1 helicase [Elysia marginata]
MLLWNLDPVNGHCNGTRYLIDNLYDHIIDVTIACGPHAGKRIFIPRIPIIPSDNIFSFYMKRKQFPVRPAFVTTTNKAQGQTVEQIGIYLKNHFFTHGQLKILTEEKDDHRVYASNIVYKEVLRI